MALRDHSLFMLGGGGGGALARIRGAGITPILGQSEGASRGNWRTRGGALSDFTILFYFKEMCSLLSAVLNGT